ncbi:hypothetical protein [Cellulomonas chengniuliangii]|uniref:Lysyl-tRNA synthetase n=1 Tax=Cellulomonas chengniuliangii TaxID=2968084 RepID=A0ABY5L5H9_9CELL|nr:hypothetical protein [Cellulomonas chengniuliangii]MCC2307366.1 hypothetical protein [Cellulomonas chengniuliangii]UUI75848.1 hypothetical protein NP064_02745 [Cellulomonas chengniuliangii]
MNSVTAALAAIVPSIGVGALFWLTIRSLVNADRNERAALARLDAQEAAAPSPIVASGDSES